MKLSNLFKTALNLINPHIDLYLTYLNFKIFLFIIIKILLLLLIFKLL